MHVPEVAQEEADAQPQGWPDGGADDFGLEAAVDFDAVLRDADVGVAPWCRLDVSDERDGFHDGLDCIRCGHVAAGVVVHAVDGLHVLVGGWVLMARPGAVELWQVTKAGGEAAC